MSIFHKDLRKGAWLIENDFKFKTFYKIKDGKLILKLKIKKQTLYSYFKLETHNNMCDSIDKDKLEIDPSYQLGFNARKNFS